MNFNDSSYREKPGFIYLINAVGTDRYKIGRATRWLETNPNKG